MSDLKAMRADCSHRQQRGVVYCLTPKTVDALLDCAEALRAARAFLRQHGEAEQADEALAKLEAAP